jgi:hypothetical protein
LGIVLCGLACCLCSENMIYKIKARAFAEFARRYGAAELLGWLERNEKTGIICHREDIMGITMNSTIWKN